MDFEMGRKTERRRKRFQGMGKKELATRLYRIFTERNRENKEEG